MIFIKTLSNSWCTTERFHEIVRLPCVFGCPDCKDNLSHYLKCEPFWTIIISSLNMHQSWLQCSPAAKLCLTHISSHNLYLLGILFKTYHALRTDFEDLINKAVASQDFCDVLLKASFLAKLFAFEFKFMLVDRQVSAGALCPSQQSTKT